jgi:hypothetical protein
MIDRQGVTKRCLLSWLTNSALVYEPKFGGREGVAGSQPKKTEQLYTGAQTNLGDLTTYVLIREGLGRTMGRAWGGEYSSYGVGGKPNRHKSES